VLELRGTKYHEALFLDADGAIAEGPGENFFIIKNGQLFTPPLGTILSGITRSSVIEIARAEGLTVTVRSLTLDDALSADEAFFTGTAAEITPIGTINDQPIGTGKAGPITKKLEQVYLDVVHGRYPGFEKFLTYVAS